MSITAIFKRIFKRLIYPRSVSHVKFIEKFELPFSLIADEDKKIVDKYNLWGQKKFMGRTYMGTTRTTFLIDEAGIVKHIIEKPDTKDHTKEILEISGW